MVKEENTVHVGDHKAWLAYDNSLSTSPACLSLDEEETNIMEFSNNLQEQMQIFSIDGQPLRKMEKGINIIRLANGKTVKKVVK